MEKVDLEALDAMHAAAHSGQWKAGMTKNGRRQVYKTAPHGGQVCAVWGNYPDHGSYTADYIAALHNAYPAMAAELRELRERVASLYTGMRRVIVAAGGVAEDGVSDEFLLNAAGEVRALREERDRLRAEVESLKAKWKREECAHCDERPGGHEGTIWCAECFNWHCSEAGKERMQSELDAAMAKAARLREALESAVDELLTVRQDYADGPSYCQSCLARCDGKIADIHHSADCAGMMARDALASTTTTAEWLAARDAEQRRIGAAEWLEKEAAENLERFGTHFYESTTDSMLAEAARLRAGKGK